MRRMRQRATARRGRPLKAPPRAAAEPPRPRRIGRIRAEYDLYNSIAHEQDPKKRLALLDQWTQKYPKTDFEDLRNQTYVATLGPLSQQDPSIRPKLIEYAKKELTLNPKNFTALYWLARVTPAAGGNSPTPEQLSDAQTAGRRTAGASRRNLRPIEETSRHVASRLGEGRRMK